MSANGISSLSTKQAKQTAKLDLAALKRQGYTLNSDGSIASGPDITKPFYRTRNQYDITELPTQYSNNTLVDNINEDGLILGRPWIVAPTYPAGTISYMEMNGGTKDSGDIEDSTATYLVTNNGFTLNDPINNGSAVVLRMLSTTNDNFFDTNIYNSGYIWTATWATGSTYHTTPVAMYYELFQSESLTVWILDPNDLTYNTPVSPGTFKFPVTFAPLSTPTTTSFTN